MRIVVIDENLPRAFGRVFAENNFVVLDIRDFRLRGAPDGAIFNFAEAKQAVLATSDLHFVQRIHLSESEHNGIFLIRLPTKLSLVARCQEIDNALKELGATSIQNRIIVIGPGRLRMHG